MKTTWIVQDNLGSTSRTADDLKQACAETGYKYIPIQVIPFSTELPIMPETEGSFVLYGRTTLILSAYADSYWSQGIFFDEKLFTPESYVKHWGYLMLNSDQTILTIGEIEQYVKTHEIDEYFIKPNDDLKQFTGQKMTSYELLDFYNRTILVTNGIVNSKTLVSISSVKEILREWRLIIVDGKVITASQYLPIQQPFVPPEVIDFGNKCAQIHSPAGVYVMDVSFDTDFKIIECNCFNGSGFYECDLSLIIKSVSEFVMK